jgi:hypothetical protein
VLHQRAKQKKHEGDGERDKIKKTISYMEAVCYFCLCSITQFRTKKAAAASASTPNPPTTSKSCIDLLRETYELLKYLNEKLVKPIDNELFIKRFRVLS